MDITKLLGGAFRVNSLSTETPEQQLSTSMINAGFTPPSTLLLDSDIHRFGKKNNKWYIAYADEIPAGVFGDWKSKKQFSWCAETGHTLTLIEQASHLKRIEKMKAIRKAKTELKHENAAQAVSTLFDNLPPASAEHPYLQRKGTLPHNLRQTENGRLVAPLYNVDGALTSIQYISSKGDKYFFSGGEIKGSFNVLGKLSNKFFVAEGYATGSTIYEETGTPTVIAYSASNIPEVVRRLRETYDTSTITVVADKDDNKTGEKYANIAAEKYGCKVIVSPTDSDVNDYKQEGGDITTLLNPKQQWLQSVSDFTAQPKPIKWLIKHWLQDEALIMAFGQSGAGKTFVVLDWALRIATPSIETWCGEKVRHGDVAYLAGEGHAGLRARCKAWIQHNQITEDIRMFVSNSGTDLNTPEGLQQTIDAIREMEIKPRLIVVDTLHRFLQGDENSAQDSKSMLDACAVLTREFGCSVMLVHHTGVSQDAQKRGRGSSAWKGALEQEICIEKDSDKPFIKVSQTKNKDAEPAPPKNLELATIDIKGWFDEDDEQVHSAILTECEAQTKAPKANKKLEKYVDIFKRAWFASGAESAEDKPYLTRSALREKLTADNYGTARTIKNNLNTAYKENMIGLLLEQKVIKDFNNGWVVIDPVEQAVFSLTKN